MTLLQVARRRGARMHRGAGVRRAAPAHRGAATLFLSPALLVIGAFVLVPLGLTVWISLHEWSMYSPLGDMTWVGLDNYRSLWTSGDFRGSLWRTFLYGLMVVGGTLPLAFLLSLLLYFPTARGRNVVRAILFSTYVIPTVAVALVWGALYAPGYGPLDQIVTALGMQPVGWISDPDVALLSLALFNVWQMLGYYTILLVAGLTQIPADVYEAARVDGAGQLRQTASITIPLLQRTLVFVGMIAVINAVQVFDPVYLLTQGGPSNSTNVLTFDIQRTAFQFGLAGQASAMAISLLLVLAILAGALSQGRRLVGRR
ncbi:sugar ABC transporter permease [Micromonospora soli]|uniref:carbohydrate ABC transporter permease n=1 Tax=Micromonospora sp. NBRC 110009 TaxID=3061627 RepID=UPI002673140A|nr:sugar ABC transporter permease [Micromonospora sp. NBRC 110009]WKT96934.1 sugar ABC transporter permease [Micromonospora sp. NBRC 110009]